MPQHHIKRNTYAAVIQSGESCTTVIDYETAESLIEYLNSLHNLMLYDVKIYWYVNRDNVKWLAHKPGGTDQTVYNTNAFGLTSSNKLLSYALVRSVVDGV